jgi:hypothetical protein
MQGHWRNGLETEAESHQSDLNAEPLTEFCRVMALIEERPRQTNQNFKFFVISKERTDNLAIENVRDTPAQGYVYGHNSMRLARQHEIRLPFRSL